MPTQSITKIEFSILFQAILEKAFGPDFNHTSISREKLCGFNRELHSPESIRGKILTATNHKICGRKLNSTINQYIRQGKHDSFLIQHNLLTGMLLYLKTDSPKVFYKAYFQSSNIDPENYDPINFYTSQHDPHSKKSNTPLSGIDEKLENLANTSWRYYTHYLDIREGYFYTPKILRLPLNIFGRESNGDYGIEISQEKPYTTFTGKIIRRFSGDNILVCELSSKEKRVPKRLYMYIHVNLDGTGDLFLGTFMRYSDGGTIYTGSFVMEKIDKNSEEKNPPKIFNYIKDDENGPNEAIKRFLYDRALNLVKLPVGIFTQMDLKKWLNNNHSTFTNPQPTIDLYITAPIRGFQSMLKAETFDFEEFHSPKSFEEMRDQIIEMTANLKEKSSDFKHIWYFPAEEGYMEKQNLDPNYILQLQLEKFKNSKRILIILPFPSVTSTILEAGWTMLTDNNKPIYILYSGRQHLPFLLRKADTLPRKRIYMTSLPRIGGIKGIPDWIIHNEYDKLF